MLPRLSKMSSLLSLVTVFTPALLVAQLAGVPDFSGNWQAIREFYECGDWNIDHNGQVRQECTAPIDQMPANARLRAWPEYFDEPMSGMWDCAPAPLPSILSHPTPTNIVQRPDRILISYEHDDGRRTVWVDAIRPRMSSSITATRSVITMGIPWLSRPRTSRSILTGWTITGISRARRVSG
jgi:hypothetical protein